MKRYISVDRPVDFAHFPVYGEISKLRSAPIVDPKWSKTGAICFHGFLEAGCDLLWAYRFDQLDEIPSSIKNQIVLIFDQEYHGTQLWGDPEANLNDILRAYVPKELDQAVAEATAARYERDFRKVCEICEAASGLGDRDMYLYLRAKSRGQEGAVHASHAPLHVSELRKATEMVIDENGKSYYHLLYYGWYTMEENGQWAIPCDDPQEKEIVIVDDDD